MHFESLPLRNQELFNTLFPHSFKNSLLRLFHLCTWLCPLTQSRKTLKLLAVEVELLWLRVYRWCRICRRQPVSRGGNRMGGSICSGVVSYWPWGSGEIMNFWFPNVKLACSQRGWTIEKCLLQSEVNVGSCTSHSSWGLFHWANTHWESSLWDVPGIHRWERGPPSGGLHSLRRKKTDT